jgi:hypothetical protein
VVGKGGLPNLLNRSNQDMLQRKILTAKNAKSPQRNAKKEQTARASWLCRLMCGGGSAPPLQLFKFPFGLRPCRGRSPRYYFTFPEGHRLPHIRRQSRCPLAFYTSASQAVARARCAMKTTVFAGLCESFALFAVKLVSPQVTELIVYRNRRHLPLLQQHI